jgi:PIN domain nuclease of toxin-antitoxin system
MMFLDTHAAVWLYQGETVLFSEKGRILLENEILTISPAVLLELEYLYEVGRLIKKPGVILEYLEDRFDLSITDTTLLKLIIRAKNQLWTGDPFDRLIVSHADIEQALLLTKDETILAHYSEAVW